MVGVVVVGVVGVVVVGVGAVYWPTVIVTVLPFLAVVPGAGLCLSTIPFRLGRVTAFDCCTTLNPALCSDLAASDAAWPFTSGTGAVVGACATTIVTVLPEATVELPAGVWLITFPGFTVLEVRVVALTWKPAL